MSRSYKVQVQDRVSGTWRDLTGAYGNRGYCMGWFDCMTSFYPCPAVRLVHVSPHECVIETHPGNTAPTVNDAVPELVKEIERLRERKGVPFKTTQASYMSFDDPEEDGPVGAEEDRPHLDAEGRFQSDKYPTTPPDLVPLKVTDKTAQGLLWEYAQRRRVVDEDFANDLEHRLKEVGFCSDPTVATLLAASPLLLASMCDEIEQLRAQVAELKEKVES